MLLVSHRERSIDVWTRYQDGWSTLLAREGDTAELATGARIDVREAYEAAAEPSA